VIPPDLINEVAPETLVVPESGSSLALVG